MRALRDRYLHILKVLTRISLTSEKQKERSEAMGLCKKMESFEFIVFIVFLERILRSFNTSSKEIQSPKLDLSAALRLLSCVQNELQHLRDNYQSVLETASAIASSWKIKPELTHSRRYFFGNQRLIQDIADPEEFFRVNVFYRTIDIALTELLVRFKGQSSTTSLFSFLAPAQLRLAGPIDIERSIKELLKSYHFDLSDELVSDTRSFVVEFREEIGDQKTVRDVLQLLYEYRIVSSFPQLQKLLTLFLTIPVTVASAVRSFSKLKLIKTYLRSTMRQSRLADLAILSIENAEAKIMDFSNLIKQFASVKAERERKF